MIKYASIVFMQGEEYDQAVDHIRNSIVMRTGCDPDMVWSGTREWCDALCEYLKQWDYGEPASDEVFDDGVTADEIRASAWDSSFYDYDKYVIEYDTRIGYCGLRRAYEPESE